LEILGYLGLFFVWWVVASFGGCSVSESRFKNAMRNEGLVDATQGEYDFFECGYGDVWVSSFTARRPAKKDNVDGTFAVQGTACCGLIKGCTVRWE